MIKKKLLSNKRLILSFLLIYLASFLIYWPSLKYFFLQDDWFHLSISNAANIKEFFSLFAFRTDIIAWRPVSKQIFFFLNHNLFGLNPLPYHLVIFIFFALNVFLVYKLINDLFKNPRIGILTSFFYTTSSIHFISLSWISAGEYIIGIFFWLITSILYLNYRNLQKKSYHYLSILFFLICLTSSEFALTLPFLLIIYNLITQKKIYLRNFIHISPFLFMVFIYGIIRYYISPIPAVGNYSLMFDHRIITTAMWYILWTLNIPEFFKYQIRFFSFKIANEPTVFWALKSYILQLTAFTIAALFFGFSALLLLLKNLNNKTVIYLGLSLLFFLLTLSPVLFLPNHTFPHYLSIPSLGLYTFLSFLIVRSLDEKKINFPLILITSFLIMASINIYLLRKNYWIQDESTTSQTVFNLARSKYSQVSKNAQIFILNTNENTSHSLMDQYAMRVIYNDKSVETVYINDQRSINDLNKLPYYIKLKVPWIND